MELTSEHKFLLNCSRVNVTPEIKNKLISLIKSPLNWHNILSLSISHRIAPIVYRNLLKLNTLALIPCEIKAQFEEIYNIVSQMNKLMIEELVYVNKTLSSKGISTVVLKGPVLANTVYPDIALRQFCDIDMLIDLQNYPALRKILYDLGYKQGHMDHKAGTMQELTQKEALLLAKRAQEFPIFVRKSSNKACPYYDIDVHYRFFYASDPYHFPIQEFFADARFIDFLNEKVLVPSIEHMLIHLCIHLYWHATEIGNIMDSRDLSVILFCDIYEWIRFYSDELDWDKIIRILENNKLILPVFYSLICTEKIYRNIIPSAIRSDIVTDYLRKQTNMILVHGDLGEDDMIGYCETAGYWSTDLINRIFNPDRMHDIVHIKERVDIRDKEKKEMYKLQKI